MFCISEQFLKLQTKLGKAIFCIYLVFLIWMKNEKKNIFWTSEQFLKITNIL